MILDVTGIRTRGRGSIDQHRGPEDMGWVSFLGRVTVRIISAGLRVPCPAGTCTLAERGAHRLGKTESGSEGDRQGLFGEQCGRRLLLGSDRRMACV